MPPLKRLKKSLNTAQQPGDFRLRWLQRDCFGWNIAEFSADQPKTMAQIGESLPIVTIISPGTASLQIALIGAGS